MIGFYCNFRTDTDIYLYIAILYGIYLPYVYIVVSAEQFSDYGSVTTTSSISSGSSHTIDIV